MSNAFISDEIISLATLAQSRADTPAWPSYGYPIALHLDKAGCYKPVLGTEHGCNRSFLSGGDTDVLYVIKNRTLPSLIFEELGPSITLSSQN